MNGKSSRQDRRKRALIVDRKSREMLVSNIIAPAKPITVKPAIARRAPPTIQITQSTAERETDSSSASLVFCSTRRAGGGWMNGAAAQEEDVALASTWAIQAATGAVDFYQHPGMGSDSEVLLAESIFYKRGFTAILMGVQAPNRKSSATAKYSNTKLIEVLTDRLATAFTAAKAAGASRLVIGAIGCGVHGWDPKDTATALSKALCSAPDFSDGVFFALPASQAALRQWAGLFESLGHQAKHWPPVSATHCMVWRSCSYDGYGHSNYLSC